MSSLEVGKEGNPLTQTPYWRLYAVFRLSHWGLRIINGVEVCHSYAVLTREVLVIVKNYIFFYHVKCITTKIYVNS